MLTFQWLIMACFQAVRWSQSPSQACDSPVALWLQWHWHLGVTQKSPQKPDDSNPCRCKRQIPQAPGPRSLVLGSFANSVHQRWLRYRAARDATERPTSCGSCGSCAWCWPGVWLKDMVTWWYHCVRDSEAGIDITCELTLPKDERKLLMSSHVHIHVNTSTLNLFSCTCDSVSPFVP